MPVSGFSQRVGRTRADLRKVRRTVKHAQLIKSMANEACEEARQMRADVRAQLTELAKCEGFRQRYASSILSKILDKAITDTDADMGNVQLYDPASSRLFICAQRGFQLPFLKFFDSVHAGEAACGTAFGLGRRVVVYDVLDSPVFRDNDTLDVLLDAKVRALQSTPIVSHCGQILGILSTHYQFCRFPSQKELRVIDYLAAHAAQLVEGLLDFGETSSVHARRPAESSPDRNLLFNSPALASSKTSL